MPPLKLNPPPSDRLLGLIAGLCVFVGTAVFVWTIMLMVRR